MVIKYGCIYNLLKNSLNLFNRTICVTGPGCHSLLGAQQGWQGRHWFRFCFNRHGQILVPRETPPCLRHRSGHHQVRLCRDFVKVCKLLVEAKLKLSCERTALDDQRITGQLVAPISGWTCAVENPGMGNATGEQPGSPTSEGPALSTRGWRRSTLWPSLRTLAASLA